MKKLKVTWQDGSWNRDGDQPVAEADLFAQISLVQVGDTLVFKDGGGTIHLVVPETLLISAVQVEVEDPA